MSLGKIIGILDWLIKRYESVKKWIGETYRRYRARKIRDAIDSGDKRTIDDAVRRIKQKRRDRNDAS